MLSVSKSFDTISFRSDVSIPLREDINTKVSDTYRIEEKQKKRSVSSI